MKKLLILLFLSFSVFKLINTNNYITIPEASIRMRVIAASNNPTDIKNKTIIKNDLEKELTNVIKDSKNIYEADYKIKENEETIKRSIDNTLKKNNIKEAYKISYGDNYFPEKKLGGVLYKAGNYKSYVVTLGKGEGNNFWCVLFPPLCLIDESNNYNYKFLIEDILSKYD